MINDKTSAKNNLTESISAFRVGQNAQAGYLFAKVLDYVIPELERNTVSFNQVDYKFLEEMLNAQTICDYLYLADMLEYKLPHSGFSTLF